MEGVRCARLPRRFVPDQVTGGGVNLTGAARFHAQGYEGEGVRVAVIDVGFKGLGAAVASGDLPHDVISLDFTGSGIETEYRHGTACAEIVHEMAPGAELHLLKIRDEIHLYDAFDYCLEQGNPCREHVHRHRGHLAQETAPAPWRICATRPGTWGSSW